MASLRARHEEEVRTLWRETEAEGERLRRELAAELACWQEEHDRQTAVFCRQAHDRILADAERPAARQELEAVAALAARLWAAAGQLLAGLRDDDDRQTFQCLAAELPPAPWAVIRVAPADAGLARELFPAARIEMDPALAGGLVAVSADGCIRVDNSLATRLAALWPEILTRAAAEILERCAHAAPGPPAGP
ncbi:MAG: V-type ATP synthase subunit E [Thermodesulfobacteriota bacterium]